MRKRPPSSHLLAQMEGSRLTIQLLDEYHVKYENRAKHSGRQVKLTYMVIDNVEYEVIE